eukprot:CAMPEP_0117660646 /NCGR_PEP_ID=MMETSP0804-20121206/7077_1 /TAXON_ID=1074897 /ORGANISM="Tetraselmis astigmatica, Strain CCMP880" /LENGTH=316 /DNA_ID=CAMNT_0005467385 /DNA_START=86 /DNA_END=1036 /DNA_ORIENTATION=-
MQARASTMMMGCKYRQRTGSCSCDNPPMGCLEPEDRPTRVGGHPVHSNTTTAPPAPPQPLPTEFPVHGASIQVPSMGWRCCASTAGEAVAAGVRFLDGRGDPEAEAAIKAAGPLQAALLATVVHLAKGEGAAAAQETCYREAVDDAAARLGRPPAELLVYAAWQGSLGVEQAVAAWTCFTQALSSRAGLLGLECGDAASAALLLRELQAKGIPLPSVLLFETTPTSPCRALIGLCRRLCVLPVALGPLQADPRAVADGQPPSHALLAWSAAREMPCLASTRDAAAAGVPVGSLLAMLAAPLPPLDPRERATLNTLG